MSEFGATNSALLTNAIGLHARPSVKLTKLAKTFESRIEVGLTENGPWVDAKSIVKVMAVKAAKGATLFSEPRVPTPRKRSSPCAIWSPSTSMNTKRRVQKANPRMRMAELRLTGRVASSGFAAGPLALLLNSNSGNRSVGNPVAEAQALHRAIAAALSELSDLAANAEGDGAEILAFQIAMLEDDTLAEPAFAMIAAGASADQGWRKALDDEIAGYEAADDEHFKARASDLKDISDRVLAGLFGATAEPGPPAGAIIVGEDMTPSRFLATDWSCGGGIALTRGSASGHVATLARSRGIPMIVGLPLDLSGVAGSREAFIDGESATLCIDPAPETRDDFAARAKAADRASNAWAEFATRPAMTGDGIAITVCLNIADPAEIERTRSGELRWDRARPH